MNKDLFELPTRRSDLDNPKAWPTSREEAQAHGAKRYYSGEECKLGHISTRYTKSGRCTECQKLAGRKFRENNPDYAREKSKKYKEDNAERLKEYSRSYHKKIAERGDSFHLQVKNIRLKCRKKGIPFDIDADYIQQLYDENPNCPVTGERMELQGKVGQGNNATIDRFIPELGYVRGNVNIISHRANMAKGKNTDPEFFRRLADWIETQERL